jgi:hypothetical protein
MLAKLTLKSPGNEGTYSAYGDGRGSEPLF